MTKITLSCREGMKLADVAIILDNKMPQHIYGAHGRRVNLRMDASSWGAGSIYVYEYVILWTCGGEKTCLARESWGLIPE